MKNGVGGEKMRNGEKGKKKKSCAAWFLFSIFALILNTVKNIFLEKAPEKFFVVSAKNRQFGSLRVENVKWGGGNFGLFFVFLMLPAMEKVEVMNKLFLIYFTH